MQISRDSQDDSRVSTQVVRIGSPHESKMGHVGLPQLHEMAGRAKPTNAIERHKTKTEEGEDLDGETNLTVELLISAHSTC